MSAFADFSRPPDWTEQALCAEVDAELWWPTKGGSPKAAKKVCARCDVIEQCLAYALEHHEHYGIWGGMSERDRRALKDGAAA